MTEPTNGDLMRALGNLEAQVSDGVKNAEAEVLRANQSRRVLHDKIENTNVAVGNLAKEFAETSFSLRITAELAAQTRNNFDAFVIRFEEEVTPIIEGVQTFQTEAEPILGDIRKARNAIIVLAAVLGFLGFGVAGTLTFANDYAKYIIKEWLDVDVISGIPPIN